MTNSWKAFSRWYKALPLWKFLGLVVVLPGVVTLVGGLGWIWVETGTAPWALPKAITHHERSLTHKGSYLNMIDDAEEYLGSSNPQEVAYGFLYRATGYCGVDDFDKCLADYDRARKSAPDAFGNIPQARIVADVLAEKGQYEGSVRLREELTEKFPTLGNLWGHAYFLALTKNDAYRDPARAVSIARQAFGKVAEPGYKDWEMLGEILASNREFKEARVAIKRALELYPTQSQLAERIKARLEKLLALIDEEKEPARAIAW